MDRRRRSSAPSTSAPPPLEFGIGPCTPQCLQFMNKAVWLLVWMSLANVFQSMLVNGLVGTVITTLEKRFDLTSAESSVIISGYDISTIPMLILVSYFGSRTHRARLTAIGQFVLVVGTLIFVLPHFLSDDYNPTFEFEEHSDEGVCDLEMSYNRTCKADTENYYSMRRFLPMFIIGRLMHGVGAVPLYTIAVTFMDDCVSKETFSLYIAIFYAAGILGPALGYMVGGYLLNIYVDWTLPIADQLSPDDPLWIGAWWPGFLLGVFVLFVVALPMVCYPRDLPGAAAIRGSKQSEAYEYSSEQRSNVEVPPETEEEQVGFRELLLLVKGLCLNPTYIFLTLFVCCDSLLTGGFTAFGPKYVESQFSISAAIAGIVFGAVVVPGGAGGTVVGGFLVKKLNMSCRSIMKWEVVFTVCMLSSGLMFFITCSATPFAGVSTTYAPYNESHASRGESTFPVEPGSNMLNDECNQNCRCDNLNYRPVCGANNILYHSACHAGCTLKEGKTYMNCSCIINGTSGEYLNASSTVHCSNEKCESSPAFMVLIFIAMFLLFSCSSMNISATVRCVPAYQRSLAIGIQWIMIRLLGTIPGPVIFGFAFDAACRLRPTSCGQKGPCVGYNNNTMGVNLFMICVAVKIVSLIFIVLAWRLYKPPKGEEHELDNIQPTPMVSNGHAPAGVDSPVFRNDESTHSKSKEEETTF